MVVKLAQDKGECYYYYRLWRWAQPDSCNGDAVAATVALLITSVPALGPIIR